MIQRRGERTYGLLVHDFADEAIHRSNSASDFTAAENLCPMDIPSCQIGPGTFAKETVLGEWDDWERAAKLVVSGGEPECWSFRRRR